MNLWQSRHFDVTGTGWVGLGTGWVELQLNVILTQL